MLAKNEILKFAVRTGTEVRRHSKKGIGLEGNVFILGESEGRKSYKDSKKGAVQSNERLNKLDLL